MPYRGGGEPRIVAGTTGLTATTWSPGHEKWGATQANNNFEKDFHRLMLPIDYQAYVATAHHRRGGDAQRRRRFRHVSAFIHGPDLQLAPFKGIKQQFRPWDGQFRQPILIATDKVPVSFSPQRGLPRATARRSRWIRSASTSRRASARCSLSVRRCRTRSVALLVEQRHVVALQDHVDVVLVLGEHLVDLVLPLGLVRAAPPW